MRSIAVSLALLVWSSPCLAVAREHTFDFESQKTSWTVELDSSTSRLTAHSRSRENPHGGNNCESVVIDSRNPIFVGSLAHPVPPARVIDELVISLWYRSNRDGARLLARVVLPNQINPVDEQPLTVTIAGSSYTDPTHWQALTCEDLDTQLKKMLPALRRKLHLETGKPHQIDTRGSYVDSVMVEFQSGKGETQIAVDDLALAPVISPSQVPAAHPVHQVQALEPQPQPQAEFHLGRLLVESRPFFPLIVPYHGEQPGELAQLGFNVAWVPDYRDTALLEDLARMGLRGMAIPPRLAREGEAAPGGGSAQLAPFGPETSPILLWYLGTRIPPESRRALLAWEEQIRNADHKLRRPLMADVTGQEREFSRHVPMISYHRPALQNSLGLRNYRDDLAAHRRLAKQGAFFWTWLPTEPDSDLQEARESAGLSSLAIEPEQLRLQAYSAIAAGAHGVGYWSQSTLDGVGPLAAERRLAIAQLNLEFSLLEPWLATGTVQNHTPFSAGLPAQRNNQPSAAGLAGTSEEAARREAINADRQAQARQRQSLSRELEATILRTDYGTLVLPIWYGEDAQYCPGAMAANEVRIVIPGVGDTASAWEVSTTAIQRIVDSTRVAGGRQISLRKFDMTSAVIFTDDARLIERLQARILELREASARMTVELARLKLERVNQKVLVLQSIRPQHDAPRLLGRARLLLSNAETFLGGGRFHDARLAAGDSLQLARILQKSYWNDAVQRMYSPVSSPHTLCFETLPDHWEMVARLRLARENGARNLLRSGDFEDFDTMVTEGWRHARANLEGIRTTAEVSPQARGGSFSLRLVAVPKDKNIVPGVVTTPPVTVTSPPITVYRGQMVYLSGWVKVTSPITGSQDGAMLTDSLGGPTLALRWRQPVEWQKFDLVREVRETGDLTLTLSLTGLGEVLFDDLTVLAVSPEGTSPGDEPVITPTSKPTAAGPLDFLKKIPGVKPRTEP